MKYKVKKTTHVYDDIINLPHHVSKTRKQMAIKDRAAQFSPFSAVVGHDAAVKETARMTDSKRDLDETEKTMIDDALRKIEDRLQDPVNVEIEYFQADISKAGGKYVQITGQVKKIDAYRQAVVMMDGTIIPVDDLSYIALSDEWRIKDLL